MKKYIYEPDVNDIDEMVRELARKNMAQAVMLLSGVTHDYDYLVLDEPESEHESANQDFVSTRSDVETQMEKITESLDLVAKNFLHFYVKCSKGDGNKMENVLVNILLQEAQNSLHKRYTCVVSAG